MNLFLIKKQQKTKKTNGNKYLTFTSTNKNKKVLGEYTKIWDEIKYHIQTNFQANLVNMKKIIYH